VKHHLHAIAVGAEVLRHLVHRHVRFGEQDRIALAPGQEVAHLVEELERSASAAAGRCGMLDQERHRIDTEPADAELEPEPHQLQDLLAYGRVRDVEVRLEVVEAMEVVALGLIVPAPHAGLRAGKHHALVRVARLRSAPKVEVAVLRPGVAARLLEPRVLVGRVVDDEIDDQTDAMQARLVAERDEVTEIAEPAVDAVEVRDVVAIVTVRRRVERQ
jgi:hypothetical protein